jgi:hypothetical protein
MSSNEPNPDSTLPLEYASVVPDGDAIFRRIRIALGLIVISMGFSPLVWNSISLVRLVVAPAPGHSLFGDTPGVEQVADAAGHMVFGLLLLTVGVLVLRNCAARASFIFYCMLTAACLFTVLQALQTYRLVAHAQLDDPQTGSVLADNAIWAVTSMAWCVPYFACVLLTTPTVLKRILR